MSWDQTSAEVESTGDLPAAARAPLWLLGLVVVVDLVALVIRMFWGLSGAGVGYLLALTAFVLILVFRRRYGVLTQTSFVQEPPGLAQTVVLLSVVTVVLVAFTVWPIATEISRG